MNADAQIFDRKLLILEHGFLRAKLGHCPTEFIRQHVNKRKNSSATHKNQDVREVVKNNTTAKWPSDVKDLLLPCKVHLS